jgi:hypothetical protein
MSDKQLDQLAGLAALSCSCGVADCENFMSGLTRNQAQDLADEAKRARAELAATRALLARATRFTFGPAGPYDHPHAAIEAAADVHPDDDTTVHVTVRPGLTPNSSGITRWAIQCAGWVRTHGGRWVDESTPSDRTAKFLRATRWPDAASAIALAEQLVAAGHPNLPEWTTGRRYPSREEDLDA